MKRMIATAAMLAIVTGMAMASDNTNEASKSSQFKISQNVQMGVYHLRYDAAEPGQAIIKIANEKGNVLMREKIVYEASFVRPYNLKQLPDGIYRISVENEGNIVEEIIQHVKNTPVSTVTYDVNINEVSDNKYQLVVKKIGDEAVGVKIADKNGVIFFDGTIDQMGSFSKVFDLSNIVSDNIKVEVTMGNKTIVRNL